MLNFKHPGDVGQNYFQHCLFALVEGIRSVVVGLLIIVHAFVPFIFDHVYSKHIKGAQDRINKFDRSNEK